MCPATGQHIRGGGSQPTLHGARTAIAAVCARPGGYRRGPGVKREGRAINEVTRGLEFPEGPIALGDGSVLVVEIEGGNLTRVSQDGSRTVVGQCGGGPNGAAIGPDGHAYVCNDGGLGFTTIDGIRQPFELAADNKGGSIQRVDLTTGEVETVYTHCGDAPILSGNDIVFDIHGGFYFNDTVAGAVYYGQPDGSSIHVAATGVQIPNGLGLSPDQSRLYASETYTGRIVYWDVTGVGTLSDSFVELYSAEGRHGWDGLAIDSEGNVCAADLQESGITVVSPAGLVVGKVTVPEHDPFVTNVCFGGADMRTAFITSSGLGRLYSTEWHCPGLRLNYNA
jgi:gluconolactonase